MEMIKPRYTPIHAYPKPWTSSTDGEVSGEPFVMKLGLKDELPQLDSLEAFRGELKGKIVFWDRMRKPLQPRFSAFSTRFQDEELAEAEQQIDPVPEKHIGFLNKKAIAEDLLATKEKHQQWQKLTKFFRDEGAAALVLASDFDHGMLHVDSYDVPFMKVGDPKAIPTLVISSEQFSRIVRMKAKSVKPVVKLHLKTTFHEEKKYAANVLAELPGSDNNLRDEIVMIGAHFDSWNAGTGATDNAAGSAVMMEVMRILAAIDVKPRRTVRIGLWAGEEQGYFGARDYVAKNLGDIFSGKPKAGAEKISGYFNFDNGSGKIRGIYLQGNEAARPIFAELLEPFAYLGAKTLVTQNTSWTDHVIFDAVNVPGFQFIQDPLNYMTVTHHTNLDVYEYVIEDDLKRSAVIVASIVYHVAMRDQMLPRKRQGYVGS